MLWLAITVLAYFILAVVFLVDKYLLINAIANPKVYAFLIGMAGLLVIVLIPFVNFYIPSPVQVVLSFSAGASFVLALLWFYKGLKDFAVSQVVPVIGAFNPLITFGLIYLLSPNKWTLSFYEIFSFILLIGGSILMTVEKEKSVTRLSLKISVIASFFFALSFVLTKYVYLAQPFLNGLIWTRIGGALMALMLFVIWPEIRQEIFKQKNNFEKRPFGVLLLNQTAGAAAGLLQNWAIALAPLIFLAFINALQGLQYVFLLLFSIFLSFKFPRILKEFISRKIIIQRVVAILLIGLGLILLSFK